MRNEPNSRLRLLLALITSAASVFTPPLLAEAGAEVNLIREADICVIEVASYWSNEQFWRTARLYGDGRVELRDSPTRDQSKILREYSGQLSDQEFELLWQDLVESGLYEFDKDSFLEKERATGKGPRGASQSVPTHLKFSWKDPSTKVERTNSLVLTYGASETLVYPEVPEYAAASRIIRRLLDSSDLPCKGCSR